MSHLNPEAEKTQTRLVPGILQDAVHTPKSPTRLKTRTIGRMRLAPLAFKAWLVIFSAHSAFRFNLRACAIDWRTRLVGSRGNVSAGLLAERIAVFPWYY